MDFSSVTINLASGRSVALRTPGRATVAAISDQMVGGQLPDSALIRFASRLSGLTASSFDPLSRQDLTAIRDVLEAMMARALTAKLMRSALSTRRKRP